MIEEKRRQLYANLGAWDRIKIARHPKRPFTLDYISLAFADFSELHGDRLYADDHAVVGGFARLNEHKVMVIGTQKAIATTTAAMPAAVDIALLWCLRIMSAMHALA